MALNNLATLAFRRGDLDGAEHRYRRAIAISRAHYGVDSDQVALPMRGLALTLRKRGRGEEALTTARETAAILGTWGGSDHPGALDTGMDALELAILLDRPHHDDLVALIGPISALPAGDVRACRFASLNELAAHRPDLAAARAAMNCLESSAPPTVQATAALAVARALTSAQLESADATDDSALERARSRIASLVPPDPPLQRALQAD